MTLSKEALDFLATHPAGPLEEMPQELKDYFQNSVEIFNAQAAEYIIENFLTPAQQHIIREMLKQKDKFIVDLQKDNRDMSEVFEKMLDYGKRGRIHKVG